MLLIQIETFSKIWNCHCPHFALILIISGLLDECQFFMQIFFSSRFFIFFFIILINFLLWLFIILFRIRLSYRGLCWFFCLVQIYRCINCWIRHFYWVILFYFWNFVTINFSDSFLNSIEALWCLFVIIL